MRSCAQRLWASEELAQLAATELATEVVSAQRLWASEELAHAIGRGWCVIDDSAQRLWASEELALLDAVTNENSAIECSTPLGV